MKALAFLLFLSAFAFGAEVKLAPKSDCGLGYRMIAHRSAGGGGYALNFGDTVTLNMGGKSKLRTAVFLGRLVGPDGKAHEAGFYDKSDDSLHFVPLSELRMGKEDGTVLSAEELAPTIKTSKQSGPSCASFADFNCLRLLHAKTGEETLNLGTEMDRLVELSNALYDYYTINHGPNLARLNDATWEGEYEFERTPLEHLPELKDKILEALEQGWPVRFESATRDWASVPFKSLKYPVGSDVKNPAKVKPSNVTPHGQWLPIHRRTVWQWLTRYQPRGGHAVTFLGIVEGPKGGRKILVSDPNWEYPVLWDAKELDHLDIANANAAIIQWKPREKGDESPEFEPLDPEGESPFAR